METTDIHKIRLYNQLLMGTNLRKPEEIVSYMGAMQSQAFDMAKWAIGARLPGLTNQCVDQAISTHKIIRTHVLRPTWHFASAEDIHWMLELSSPRLKPIYLGYGKSIGVDQGYVLKNFHLVEKLLEKEDHLTRQEIIKRLVLDGIDMNSHKLNQLVVFGELEGVICSGEVKGNKHSYCLLQKHLPRVHFPTKEEAIEKLTRRFFTSHAPATLQDFIWWSGMRISDAKKGLELIKDDFVSEEINGRTFWMKNDLSIPRADEDSALLLPQFDEYVVSYKDRSEIIEDQHYAKVMTKNGLFSPTIMLNGEIVGSWKKVTKNKKVDVELSFFNKTNKQIQNLYKCSIESVKAFYS